MREQLRIPKDHPGAVWRFVSSSSTFRLRPHHHTELELNLVTRGQARYLVQDRRYDLRPGTLIWLFPRQDHVLVDRSGDYEMWIGCFRPRMLRKICIDAETATLRRLDPSGDFCRQLAPDAARQLGDLLARTHATSPVHRATFAAAIAYVLTHAWERFHAAGAMTSDRNVHPSVEHAARIIRDSEDRLSIDEIAESVGLSASRLSRLFKRQTGVPLVRYRARVCLDRFLHLADRHAERDLLTLALRAGFGSYPQFHRIFRAEMKQSPLEWRRMLGRVVA